MVHSIIVINRSDKLKKKKKKFVILIGVTQRTCRIYLFIALRPY